MDTENKISYYRFDNQRHINSDVQSLIHTINLHGKNLIGIEVGIGKALSFCSILQNCPNVKELHGVDSWKPYLDYIKDPYDGTPSYAVDDKNIECIKLLAYHNIKFSGNKEKAIIHEKDSNEVVKNFKNETFDFIFLDTYLTLEQAKNDIKVWYPKLKKKGLFTGHDWSASVIQIAVNEFRKKNKIKSTLTAFDNCYAWIK